MALNLSNEERDRETSVRCSSNRTEMFMSRMTKVFKPFERATFTVNVMSVSQNASNRTTNAGAAVVRAAVVVEEVCEGRTSKVDSLAYDAGVRGLGAQFSVWV